MQNRCKFPFRVHLRFACVFGVKIRVGFYGGILRHPYFWAKIKGGVEKKDEKLKEKLQKVSEKGEKRKK